MILRDQQISRAIAIVIACDDRSRLFELNLVEANVGGDIFETISSEIAEQPHFALTLFGFADGDEVDPAIVVIVDSGHAVSANPVGFGELYAVKTLAMVVAPQDQGRRAVVSKCKVHPAVVVEVKHCDASRREIGVAGWRIKPVTVCDKLSLTGIFKNRSPIAGHNQIHGFIVVVIRAHGSRAQATCPYSDCVAYFSE